MVALVALGVALVASVASSTDDNEATEVEQDSSGTDDSGAGGADDEPQAFAVGDLVQLGDWRVQVHGVTDPLTSDNELLQPVEGNRFVAVDVEAFNDSNEPQVVSSLLCFELVDSANIAYQMTIAAGSTAQPPDGEIAPGASKRGTIVYEVSGTSNDLRLEFKCDLFSTGSAVINLG